MHTRNGPKTLKKYDVYLYLNLISGQLRRKIFTRKYVYLNLPSDYCAVLTAQCCATVTAVEYATRMLYMWTMLIVKNLDRQWWNEWWLTWRYGITMTSHMPSFFSVWALDVSLGGGGGGMTSHLWASPPPSWKFGAAASDQLNGH